MLQYKGIFHNGEIQWFNPHPKNKLGENKLQDVESRVYDLMSDHTETGFE
jgi:hypothetical protein